MSAPTDDQIDLVVSLLHLCDHYPGSTRGGCRVVTERRGGPDSERGKK